MRETKIFPSSLIPVLIIAFCLNLYSQGGWFWQNPWPQGDLLNDVVVIDGNKIIAVGANSVIITSDDDGETWDVDYYEEFNTNLQSIFFIDEYTGWICGTCYSDIQLGVILKTEDGGNTWERVEILLNSDLQGIKFFDGYTGWMSGINTSTRTPYLFKTVNGGHSWQEIELSSKEAYTCKMHFYNPDTGFVNFKEFSYYLGKGEFLKTVDGGVTWDSLYFGFDNFFFANNNDGWATHIRPGWDFSWYSIHFTNDGGQTWQEDSIQYGTGMEAIYFTDTLLTSNSGAFDFYDDYNGYYVGNSGIVRKTEDGGRGWQEKSQIATRYDLSSVFFINDQTGWIVGGELVWEFDYWDERPVVLKTSDGGNSWKKLGHGGYGSLPGWYIYKEVYFLSENIGWILPNRGILYKTVDGGNQWSVAFDTMSISIKDFHFTNKMTGYIFGEENIFLKTTDGGDTWLDAFPSCLDSGKTKYSFNRCFFLNEQLGWVLAYFAHEGYHNNLLLKTENGGATWDSLSSKSSIFTEIITDMYFINQDTGWFCGKRNEGFGYYGSIGKTENGGRVWGFNEWYYVNPNLVDLFSAISSIAFFDENNGWAIGDDAYYTEDGGDSWYKTEDNKLSFGNNSLFVLDENNGWIVGHAGKILKTKTGGFTEIEEAVHTRKIPLEFHLYQNYPNPFNPVTTINYHLPYSCQVDLSVYNILGQKIATFVSEKQQMGGYSIEWDATGFASGVYFYRLETDKGFAQSKKLILLK